MLSSVSYSCPVKTQTPPNPHLNSVFIDHHVHHTIG